MLLEGIDRDINIKDLTIEPVKKEAGFEFDPQTDVPEVARIWLKAATLYPLASFSNSAPEINSELILCSKILYPNDLKKIEFSTNDLEVAKKKWDKAETTAGARPLSYWPAFAYLKAAFGQKVDSLVQKDQFESIVDMVNISMRGNGFPLAIRLLSCALLIAPEKSDQISNEIKNAVKNYLIESLILATALATDSASRAAATFLRRALEFRLLFPREDASRIIDKNIFESLKFFTSNADNLKAFPRDLDNLGSEKVIRVAAGLALLAADGIQVSETGLELIKRGPATNFETNVPLPVRRAF